MNEMTHYKANFIPHFKYLTKVKSMRSINYISQLYCYNPKASNTPISIGFDYRKLKLLKA